MDLPRNVTLINPDLNIWFAGLRQKSLMVEYALEFWARLGTREQNAILWDVEKDKEEVLKQNLQKASLAGFAWIGNTPAAFAWAQELCPGARTAIAHFSFCSSSPKEARLPIGRAFLNYCSHHFDMLTCLMPITWVKAIAYIEKLGFADQCVLPLCCYIARHKRLASGKFLIINLRTLKN